MVKLRLKRMGSKFNAFYRVVAADERAPRDGKYIEEIGYYNPHSKEIRINEELKNKWLSQGAVPSETVKRLFAKVAKLTTSGEVVVLPKKLKKAKKSKIEEIKEEEAKEEVSSQAPAETKEETSPENKEVVEKTPEVKEEAKEEVATEDKSEQKEETPKQEDKPAEAKEETKDEDKPASK